MMPGGGTLCAELGKYSNSAKIAKSKFGQSEFVISFCIIFENTRKKKMAIISNGLASRSPQSCVSELNCFCYN